jgi:Protein of unknown function (DUF2281)
MLETTILENLQKLPDSLKQDVLHYIESLVEQYETQTPEETKPDRRQAYGIWKGQIKMSNDFDEPLEDLKDYME